MTEVHLLVKDVPAGEGEPFQLFIDETLVYEDTSGTADDEVVVKVEQKGFHRSHIIKLRIKITKIDMNSIQQFNITDNGPYLAIFNDQGRLKIMQRHDGNFSYKSKEATTISANPKNFRTVKKEEHKMQGFVINPRTGLKQPVNASASDQHITRLDSPSIQLPQQPSPVKKDPIEEIEMLASLRDKGILTEEEFTQKKRQILGL
jgi:hypothetical protein